ncbi:Component of a membrane-bound complex containing the Tor2p kinase [Coemansia furcata]|uniref:Component of a membrane-bound complex containing the Tor2p kinase n=1 Tax=Coemansia furcata TaxID=417177 RepID=A0ACC1LC59_9FUNG|nr:Component of a membrane-bound complex containing the Tor2p kinase [Coemansia furcata]
MPPRRSLDTSSLSAQQAAQAGGGGGGERRARHLGHAASSSVATIRLQQRPSNGSSRDAMALGMDFDVKSMFDAADHAATSPEFKAQQRLPPSSKTSSSSSESSSRDCSLDHDRVPGAMPSGGAPRPTKRQGSETASQQASVRGAGSIALRANRSDTTARMLLSAQQRTDDAASSTAPTLKRSVTLPTKRPGAYNYHAGQKSKWVGGAYADAARQHGPSQASGWVGGAEQTTSWDQSSDDDDEVTPLSRRGASTHTWYGPRAGIRPISMFPPHAAYPIPPMPLMFGADDSDDDIDLDGDDGSSRTPALIGLGFGRGLLRPRAASPTPSLRSRKSSVAMLGADTRRLFPKPALATSVPVSSPLSATPVASAVSGAKYEHLALEASAARPRGISDPERRLSARASKADSPLLLPALGPNVRLGGSTTVELPQGPDDATPLVSARALDWSFKSACATAAASIGSKGQAGGQPDLAAKSEYVPPSTPAKSGLSALLSSKIEIRQNPFSEEFSAIGNPTNGSSLLALKVFVIGGDGAQSQLLNVKVRQSATVEQVIGFAFHRYIDDGLTPPLEHDLQDVVMWALRIADDGEVDDDFPALDRTRPVASFGYDEFALCLSTPDQVKLNEDIRVRQGRPSRMVRPKSILPIASSAATTTKSIPSSAADASSGSASRQFYCNIAHRVEVSTVVLQPSRAATSSTASIFVGTAAPTRLASQVPTPFGNPARRPSSPGSSTSAMCESRLFKIRVLDEPQSAEALRTTTVETDTSATIDMVLALVCRKKQFSEDRYALGVLEDDLFIALDTDMRVSQIPLGVELCLQKVGGATSLAPEAYDRAPRWSNDGAVSSGALLAGTKTSTVDGTGADSSSVYHTFRVIRRAQMFARHERSLVIDGDVVTLMPSDHRIETAKTLTFHISNIVCKRNQKSPRKIRLFISRRGSTGEKSVDLEAMSEEDALQICNILLRLHDQYVSNGT